MIQTSCVSARCSWSPHPYPSPSALRSIPMLLRGVRWNRVRAARVLRWARCCCCPSCGTAFPSGGGCRKACGHERGFRPCPSHHGGGARQQRVSIISPPSRTPRASSPLVRRTPERVGRDWTRLAHIVAQWNKAFGLCFTYAGLLLQEQTVHLLIFDCLTAIRLLVGRFFFEFLPMLMAKLTWKTRYSFAWLLSVPLSCWLAGPTHRRAARMSEGRRGNSAAFNQKVASGLGLSIRRRL